MAQLKVMEEQLVGCIKSVILNVLHHHIPLLATVRQRLREHGTFTADRNDCGAPKRRRTPELEEAVLHHVEQSLSASTRTIARAMDVGPSIVWEGEDMLRDGIDTGPLLKDSLCTYPPVHLFSSIPSLIVYHRVREHGLQSREFSRLYTRKPECSGHSSSFVSVGLVDWYPALLVLLAGTLTSIFLLLLEMVVHKKLCCASRVSLLEPPRRLGLLPDHSHRRVLSSSVRRRRAYEKYGTHGETEAAKLSVGRTAVGCRSRRMETAVWTVLVLCLVSVGECLDTDLLLFLRDMLGGTMVVVSCWPTRGNPTWSWSAYCGKQSRGVARSDAASPTSGQSMELMKALSQSGIMTSVQDCTGHISVPVPYQPATFLLDLQSEDAARLMRLADEMALFSSPNRWLMIMALDVITISNGTEPEVPDTSPPEDYGPLKELLSLLSSMKVFIDSQVTVVRRLEDGSFSLTEVYRMGLGQKAVVRTTGLWQRQSGLRTTEFSLPARRTNLHKTLLKTAIVVRVIVPSHLFGNINCRGIRVSQMDWLAQSPYLNPIERLWDGIERRLSDRSKRLTSLITFATILQEEWSVIPPETIQPMVDRLSHKVTNNDTLEHLTDLHNKHIDTITKLNYILLLHVIDIMNASVEFTIVDTWGYPTNGSWSGMVGYLQRKEADIGATALFFTANRLPVIDYIAMTTPTRSKFVFRQPPLSFVTNVFTLPFSQGVWLSSAGLVSVCAVALYCALNREAEQSPSRTGVAWSDVVLLSLGAICQQVVPDERVEETGYPRENPPTNGIVRHDSHMRPGRGLNPDRLGGRRAGSQIQSSGPSGRIVTLFLFVAVLFLYTSYSGCIVALLQSSTDSIRTLEDLLNSRLEVGAHDIVYNRYYFETATDPVRKGLYRKVMSSGSKKPNFLELEEGVEKVRRGLFAFHVEESSGYKVVLDTYTEEEKCGLQGIGGYIQVPDPWVAVRKDTPYKELMKRGALAGAAVAQWLGRSPPTTAIRARSPADSLPDPGTWQSCWTMPLVSGYFRSPALAFQCCSILGPHFMYYRVQEHGLQNRELARLYTRKPECSGHSSSFVSVGLVDWYPALLVLLAGTLTSIFLLLLEMVVHKKLCCATRVSLLEPPRKLGLLPDHSHRRVLSSSVRSTTEVIN
ncbi:hypothetical protein PR048_024352 [Dryococelus australis]|uniref:Uncharacterized protein n=1 Tax=Dryococelus australis TaxID=614101 RepID=A0ABQ9GNF1_9NEOP|nr:hypothetical protein PR048_024352 [Dryococelus australis]